MNKCLQTRVLFLGANNTPSGVAGYINSIVDNLSPEQFDFHAMVSQCNGGRFLSNKIHLHQFHNEYSLHNLVARTFQLRSIFKQLNPDVIHLHTARAGFLGVLAAALLRVPIIYTGHTWRFEQKSNPISSGLFRQIERYISTQADFVTFLTRRDMEIGIKHCLVPKNTCSTINTRIGCDTAWDDIKARIVKHAESQHVPTILNLGQLCDRKNPLLFLDIAKRIHKIRPDVRFEWLGDGAQRKAVEARAIALGISNAVHFSGYCERLLVETKLTNSDLLLFTSKFEGVPLAILEAKLMGLPIVASNYPGVESVVRHGIDGFVFDLNDPDVGAEKVLDLLASVQMRLKFAEEGYFFAKQEHAKPSIMANEFGDIYKRFMLINSRPVC